MEELLSGGRHLSRQALEMISSDFIQETINGRECWMRNDIRTPLPGQESALLLAPFDEFVVSSKDRSEMIDAEHYSKVMTKNGIFSPTIMLNGKIIGYWKKTMKKNAPQITLTFFEKMPKKIVALFRPEIERLEKFYTQF